MTLTYKTQPNGNVEIFRDGQRISTSTLSYAQSIGATPEGITSTPPDTTIQPNKRGIDISSFTPKQQQAFNFAASLAPEETRLTGVFTSDPNIQSQINTLPPEIQGLVNQLTRMLEKTLESGQVLNPDIELTPERLKEFTDQAITELEPYYQEVMNQAKGDIEISLNRLSEDYKREVSRAEEPFKEGLATQAESEAQAGLTYGSERGLRERQNVQSQQRSLDDVFRGVERGVQDTARAGERFLGSGFLSGLQSPQFSPFIANTQGFQQTTPRTLFNLQGGLMGEKPKQREVDIRTRAKDLEDIARRNLILDRSNL